MPHTLSLLLLLLVPLQQFPQLLLARQLGRQLCTVGGRAGPRRAAQLHERVRLGRPGGERAGTGAMAGTGAGTGTRAGAGAGGGRGRHGARGHVMRHVRMAQRRILQTTPDY